MRRQRAGVCSARRATPWGWRQPCARRCTIYGVSPWDPAAFAAAAALLACAALLAAWVPVRRALRLDPVEALRLE